MRKMVAGPRMDTVTRKAVTEAMEASMNTSFSRSLLYGISSANRIPVSGALNIADRPAADPARKTFRNRWKGRWFSLPMTDARPPPRTRLGPSSPAAPPIPMVRIEAAGFTIASLPDISPLRRWIVSRTAWVPLPVVFVLAKA